MESYHYNPDYKDFFQKNLSYFSNNDEYHIYSSNIFSNEENIGISSTINTLWDNNSLYSIKKINNDYFDIDY